MIDLAPAVQRLDYCFSYCVLLTLSECDLPRRYHGTDALNHDKEGFLLHHGWDVSRSHMNTKTILILRLPMNTKLV